MTAIVFQQHKIWPVSFIRTSKIPVFSFHFIWGLRIFLFFATVLNVDFFFFLFFVYVLLLFLWPDWFFDKVKHTKTNGYYWWTLWLLFKQCENGCVIEKFGNGTIRIMWNVKAHTTSSNVKNVWKLKMCRRRWWCLQITFSSWFQFLVRCVVCALCEMIESRLHWRLTN